MAIEPASDNVALLRRQLAANGVRNVTVRDAAAGRTTEQRDLYLRGEVSAVNSLFPDSCFGPVTSVVRVPVMALDDLVDGDADVVKIDVEGAELDVLHGMSRLLRAKPVRLIVEWHPALQVAAGYAADALPRWLIDRGFSVSIAWHTSLEPVTDARLASALTRLLPGGHSVELLAEGAMPPSRMQSLYLAGRMPTISGDRMTRPTWLRFIVCAAVVFVAGCGSTPDVGGLRASFAQQLAANPSVKGFQQNADDLRFSGPGVDGKEVVVVARSYRCGRRRTEHRSRAPVQGRRQVVLVRRRSHRDDPGPRFEPADRAHRQRPRAGVLGALGQGGGQVELVATRR